MEGDLARLKETPDPEPGVYLLTLSRRAGETWLREGRWVLFAPWELSLCELRGEMACSDGSFWQDDGSGRRRFLRRCRSRGRI